jgi:hypothetical protein
VQAHSPVSVKARDRTMFILRRLSRTVVRMIVTPLGCDSRPNCPQPRTQLVTCGVTTCQADTPICCGDPKASNSSCAADYASCPFKGGPAANCDDSSDCDGGGLCLYFNCTKVAGDYSWSCTESYPPTCPGSCGSCEYTVACHADCDCPNGETCSVDDAGMGVCCDDKGCLKHISP